MAEVFGRENHVATIPYRTNTNQSTQYQHDSGSGKLARYGMRQGQEYSNGGTTTSSMNQPDEARPTIARLLSNTERASCELPDGTTRKPNAPAKRNDPTIASYRMAKYSMSMGLATQSSLVTADDQTIFYYHGNDQPCPESGWSRSERQEAEAKPHHDHVCRSSDCYQVIPDVMSNPQMHQRHVTRQRERGNAPRDSSDGHPMWRNSVALPSRLPVKSTPKRTTSYRTERKPHTWEKHSVEVLRRRDTRNGRQCHLGKQWKSNRKTIRRRNTHPKYLNAAS